MMPPQSFSCVWLFVTPWAAAHQAFFYFTITLSLLKLISIGLVVSSNHYVLCYPLQCFIALGSFQMSQFFTLVDQSIGVSASASVLPMNIWDWFLLGLTILISLLSKGWSSVFPNTIVQKHQFFGTQYSLWSNSHIHMWLIGKNKQTNKQRSLH